jgi:hypothetical protein
MFGAVFFCDLQASPALTGLSELQEYCGVLLSYVFDSSNGVSSWQQWCQRANGNRLV